jgi:hypothetical protein
MTSSKTSSTARPAQTPFGPATVVERLSLPQRVGEQRFTSLVEVLETAGGERLVRVAYSTDGVVRRGPVTIRARDLERLRRALEKTPVLSELLAGDA